MKSRIQSVEISYLVHSTEDKEKIDDSVRRILGTGAETHEEELEGHHGNRIIRVGYHVTGDEATKVFERILVGLAPESKAEISSNLHVMLDEHSSLYIRLNKQALVEGKVETGGSEPIRVKVKARLFQLKEGSEEFYRKALEGEG